MLFQSTLPRGERLLICVQFTTLSDFNPRSREGSDNSYDFPGRLLWQFQSTLPRGERPLNRYIPTEADYISIHAPARGATLYVSIVFRRYPYFNPRSREGSDRPMELNDTVKMIFQSTLPRGERRIKSRRYSMSLLFQSTLPRGERPMRQTIGPIGSHFNPRSREGSD